MPYGYPAQAGEDVIIKIGTDVLECTEKSIDDTREEIDNTTDYELQQNGARTVRPGARTIVFNGTLIRPDFGETDAAFTAVQSAYTGKTELSAVYVTRDSTDSGTQYTGRVMQFTETANPGEDNTVACVIRLTPVSGS